ncbi:MAG TPA: hypothetical protein VD769_02275 [Gaiellaceae bacterium]|nr:hypothetical protein [Gaiellaceae bacterium]
MTTAAVHEPRRSVGSVLWFAWMVALWVVFFALLLADRLGEVWDWIVGLPLVAEIVVWLVFFPWVLGTFVWTRGWADWLRLGLVVLFAVGWTVVSIPRKK